MLVANIIEDANIRNTRRHQSHTKQEVENYF